MNRAFVWYTVGGFSALGLVGWGAAYALLSSEGKLGRPEYGGEYFFALFALGAFGLIFGGAIEGVVHESLGERPFQLRMLSGFVGLVSGGAAGMALVDAFGLPHRSCQATVLLGMLTIGGSAALLALAVALEEGESSPGEKLFGGIMLACWALLELASEVGGYEYVGDDPYSVGLIGGLVLSCLLMIIHGYLAGRRRVPDSADL